MEMAVGKLGRVNKGMMTLTADDHDISAATGMQSHINTQSAAFNTLEWSFISLLATAFDLTTYSSWILECPL